MICDRCLLELTKDNFKTNSLILIQNKNKKINNLNERLYKLEKIEYKLSKEINKRKRLETKNIILISVLSIQFSISLICFLTNF